MQRARMDTAFLFVLAADLAICILFVDLDHTGSWYVDVVPLLLASVIIPFYVGYVRGNSVIGRVKGWIYLVVGTTAVLAVIQYDFIDYNSLGSFRLAPEWVVAFLGLAGGRILGHNLLRGFPRDALR